MEEEHPEGREQVVGEMEERSLVLEGEGREVANCSQESNRG